MKKNISCIVAVFLFIISGYEQKSWEHGQIVTHEHDTVNVLILSNRNSNWNVKVIFDNGKKDKIFAKDLKSYILENNIYVSLSKSSGYYFFKQLTAGEIPLFEQNRILYTANKNLSIPLTRSNYKKELLKLTDPDSELAAKIRESSFTYQNIIDVIKKHNEKYVIANQKTIIDAEEKDASAKKSYQFLINEDSILMTTKPSFFRIGTDGLSLEAKVSKTTSLCLNAGASIRYYKNFSSSYSELIITPIGSLQYRIYTSLRERIRSQKTIDRFTSYYIAPTAIIIGSPNNLSGGSFAFGTQMYKGYMYYGFEAGIGLGNSFEKSGNPIEALFHWAIKFGFSPKTHKSK